MMKTNTIDLFDLMAQQHIASQLVLMPKQICALDEIQRLWLIMINNPNPSHTHKHTIINTKKLFI